MLNILCTFWVSSLHEVRYTFLVVRYSDLLMEPIVYGCQFSVITSFVYELVIVLPFIFEVQFPLKKKKKLKCFLNNLKMAFSNRSFSHIFVISLCIGGGVGGLYYSPLLSFLIGEFTVRC